MAGGDDDTASGATVAERPGMIGPVTVNDRPATDRPATARPSTGRPATARSTTDAAATDSQTDHTGEPTIQMAGPPEWEAVREPTGRSSPQTLLTTAADAMRNEEVDRTRTFIRMGWIVSIVAMGGVPVLHAPRAMSIALVVGLSLGILISLHYYRAFNDPARYTERALMQIAVICMVNAHIAVLYYGVFSAAPLIVVIGIHFVARTEAERAARWILAMGLALYSLSALAIITGLITDPGVFATDRPISTAAQLAGAGFVLGIYVLAHITARAFRQASLRSIESLTRATRLASQREALMDELRLDLERALRAGGPGRYSDQIVGNFKLAAVLGRGAMGEVYDAVDVATGEPAAVKLIRRDLLGDRTHVARFVREARASGALDSPYVVRVLDAGERDPLYLAMERLHGQTLAEQLRKDGRLAGTGLAELLRHIGAGLDAARLAGIVHRDIKPQNLFHDRVWKILDFGVATLYEESSGTLTQGGIIGTPSYMSPEQAQGKRLDGRADLYSLAAVAYRCITGRHPFSGADTPALLYAVVHKMPARPGEIVELAADLDRWFALALAKSPAERFATGEALATAFESALSGELDGKLRKQAEVLLRTLAWA